MRKTVDEDLRVRKTRNAIHDAFRGMLAKMPYEQITIKELAERAQINRKTFYLHYPALDDLLFEFQDNIADEFAQLTSVYNSIEDMPEITREHFIHSEQHDMVSRRILESRGGSRTESNRAMERTMHLNRRCIESMGEMDDAMFNIISAFLTSSSVAIYRQWVNDGKKIPLDDMIDIASQLICNGVLALKTTHIVAQEECVE